MKTHNRIKALHKSLTHRASILKATLQQQIEALPDNNETETLSLQCFLVSFSQVERRLDPGYYNFRKQYRMISEKIHKTAIEHMDSCILKIISDTTYHPIVKQSIADLWGI